MDTENTDRNEMMDTMMNGLAGTQAAPTPEASAPAPEPVAKPAEQRPQDDFMSGFVGTDVTATPPKEPPTFHQKHLTSSVKREPERFFSPTKNDWGKLKKAFDGDPLAVIDDPAKLIYVKNITGAMRDPETERQKIALAAYFSQMRKGDFGFCYDNLDSVLKAFYGEETGIGEAYRDIGNVINFRPVQDTGLTRAEGAVISGSGAVAESVFNLGRLAAMLMAADTKAQLLASGNPEAAKLIRDPEEAGQTVKEVYDKNYKPIIDWGKEAMKRPDDWFLHSNGIADWCANAALSLVEYFPQLAAQTGLMAVTGGVSSLATVYGVNAYFQIKDDHPEMSEAQAAVYGVGIGLINGALEKVTFGILEGKVSRDVALNGIKKGLFAAVKHFGLAAGKEGAEEGVEQLAENILDIAMGLRGDTKNWKASDYVKNLFRGVPESVFLGTMTGGPLAADSYVSLRQTAEQQAKFRDTVGRRLVELNGKDQLTPAEETERNILQRMDDAGNIPDAVAAARDAYEREMIRSMEQPEDTDADPELAQAAVIERLRAKLPHNPADTRDAVHAIAPNFQTPVVTVDAWSDSELAPLVARQIAKSEAELGRRLTDEEKNAVKNSVAAGTEAVWTPDGVKINANVVPPSRVPFVLNHEIAVHEGLERAFGKDAKNQLLDAVWEDCEESPLMQDILRRYGFLKVDQNGDAVPLDEAQRREAAEEFLANLGETNGVPIRDIYREHRDEIDAWARKHGFDPSDLSSQNRTRMVEHWMYDTDFRPERPGWLKQLIARVRLWLRQHGIMVNHLSDDDIHALLARAAQAEAKRRNGETEKQRNGEERYSQQQNSKPPAITKIAPPSIDITNTPALKDFLLNRFRNQEVKIHSDGRLTVILKTGIESTLKRKGTGRTATTELYKIIENSYPVGYEDVDLKHKENRHDLRGQFVYGSLIEIVDESGVSQKYIATIKFDDTRVDHRARFKDLAVKKIEDALSTGDPQKGLPTPSKQESSISDITIQQIIDSVKRDFEKVSGFHPITDGNGSERMDTEARASFHDAMLQAVKQKFGSGNTSNRQVAAGFKKIDFASGSVNLDLGGGKFDEGTKYLAEQGVTNLIFDPVNRDAAHNRQVFDAVKNGGVDTVTCNNVLNVIQEPEARSNVILQAAKALKSGGTAYFTVWEGDRSGNGRQSQADAWQEHRKTADYIDEIKQHFADVSVKNKVITARDPIVEGKTSAWATDSSFENPLRYSIAGGNENLVVLHNLSAAKLRRAAKLGALPVPSLAIVDAEKSDFSNFGEISLVADKYLIDPKLKGNKVFNADAYSPRAPETKKFYSDADYDRAANALKPYDLAADDDKSVAYLMKRYKEGIYDSDLEYKLSETYAVLNWYCLDHGIQTPAADNWKEIIHIQSSSEFNQWWNDVALPQIGLDPEEKMYAGNTSMGRPRWIPLTLENVVKAMTKKTRNGEGFQYGIGNIRSMKAVQFKSIAQIQSQRDHIVSAEDMKTVKEEIKNEFNELADRMRANSASNYGWDFNTGEDCLLAMAEGGRENAEYLHDRFGNNQELFREMAAFLDKLKNMPTEYFEAKPQRAVGLEEFSAAVIPNNTPADVRKMLEDAGVMIYTYDERQERKAVLQMATRDNGLRFSTGREPRSERVTNLLKLVKPILGENSAMSAPEIADALRTNFGVEVDPDEAVMLKLEAERDRKADRMRKEWHDAYGYFAQAHPLFNFLVEEAGGTDFFVKPSKTFQGEEFSGSFISPEFKRRKRDPKREQLASGRNSDELAEAYSRRHGGDPHAIEQEIIDLLRELKKSDIMAEYRDFKRESFANSQAEEQAILDSFYEEERRKIEDEVVAILEHGEGISEEWAGANQATFRELYRELLHAEPPKPADEASVAAVNAAIAGNAFDAESFRTGFEAARREFRERLRGEISDFRNQVREGRDLALKLQSDAATFIARNLPPEERSRFTKKLLHLMEINDPQKRLDAFDSLLAAIARRKQEVAADTIRTRIRTRLDQLGRRADTGRKAVGVRDEESQALIDRIRNIAQMSRIDILEETESLESQLESAREAGRSTETIEENILLLDLFGDLDGQNIDTLRSAAKHLEAVAREGKQRLFRAIHERALADGARRADLIDLMKQEPGATPSDFEMQHRKNERMNRSGLARILDDFATGTLNLWGLFDRMNYSKTGTLADNAFNHFAQITHIAARSRDTANLRNQKDCLAALDRIFGTRGSFDRAGKVRELRKVTAKTGVFRLYPDPDSPQRFHQEFITVEEAEKLLQKYDNAVKAELAPPIPDYQAEAIRHQLRDRERRVKRDLNQLYDKVSDELLKQAVREQQEVFGAARDQDRIAIISPAWDGSSREMELSPMQGLYLWLCYQQPDVRYKMHFNGFSEESFHQLEKFLAPELLEFGRWMRRELDTDRTAIDKVYRKLYFTAFPTEENYFPTYYGSKKGSISGKDVDLGKEGEGNRATAYTPGALKLRVFHLAMPEICDALTLFQNHRLQMNHFVSHAEAARELRAVFTHPDTKREITYRFGDKLYKRLMTQIGDFIQGGRVDAETNTIFQAIFNNTSRAIMTFNLASGVKQAFGAITYGQEIPAWALTRGIAYAWSHPQTVYRILGQSDYFKNRWETGFNTAMRGLLDPSGRKAGKWNEAVKKLDAIGGIFLRSGDAVSVLTGGWAVYSYTKHKLIREGMSPEEAHQRALLEWEMATERTQQSSQTHMLTPEQKSGWRILMPFKSNQILMYQKYAAAVAKGDWKSASKAIGALAVASLAMTSISQLTLHGGRWDEWSLADYLYDILSDIFSGGGVAGNLSCQVLGNSAVLLGEAGRITGNDDLRKWGKNLYNQNSHAGELLPARSIRNAALGTARLLRPDSGSVPQKLKDISSIGSAIAMFFPPAAGPSAILREGVRLYRAFAGPDEKPKKAKKKKKTWRSTGTRAKRGRGKVER